MAISRAQMGSQLKGNKMKKTKKMKKGGDLLAMISPAAAIAQSMKAGKPVGLANLSRWPTLWAVKAGLVPLPRPKKLRPCLPRVCLPWLARNCPLAA